MFSPDYTLRFERGKDKNDRI
ncbi:hypothetical protein FYL05_07055 [Lactobacillus salivarius]|uniref:Uncharacterized protein n=1 Tax=Ligilactobacillus salivarius TaxID=1624 RepID=A0A2U2M2I6_9LACO|nr:hypothetical protein [Ligilactobacillus salivarius]HBU67637.1 hypothetical protein [Lactobacillus sp.]MSE05008.1 hypothetical protein [Ligilactobacillus salivarius]MSE07558.1 hypothetical protein [Ligilactobacillus salivarius]MYU38618.1 hypothetical protein [Ligilactobacillus salivarius]